MMLRFALPILLLSICSVAFGKLSVEDFLAKPQMITAKLSDNGKYLASIWNIGGERTVVIQDLVASKIITKFGDSIIRPYDVSWANDERILVKLLVPYDTNKVRRLAKTEDDFDIDDYFMFGRVISIDIYSKNTVQLMNEERSMRRNVNLANITHYLPDDKEHVLMTSMRRGRLTLFKVNINNGETEKLVTGGRHTRMFLFDDDREQLYRYDYLRIAKVVEVKQYENESWNDIDTIYFDDEDQTKNKIDINDLAGMKDGRFVYRKLNEDTGYHELIAVKNGEREVLVSLENTDIVGVVSDGFGRDIAGYTTLSDVYRTHYFDEKRQARYDQLAHNFKDENFSVFSRSNDSTELILKSWGISNPVTYHRFSENKNQLSVLNYPYQALTYDKLAEGLKIQYPTRDKQLIDAYILLPPSFTGDKPMPLVVMPHGGPQARDTMNYDHFAQFVSTRGYLVIQPNFRGSTGYGKDFEKAGYKEWGGLMQEDLEDAVNFLISEKLVEPNQVCIVGISYGGYAALQGLVKTPDMYQCGVSINGVSHLPEQIEFDLNKFESDRLHTYIKESIGDPATDMKMLQARSPALNADKVQQPLLLIHSEKDNIVPYDQGEMMYEALQNHEKQVEMITLEDSFHNPFRYREDIETVYDAVERFLKANLSQE
ncbi:alpha/beta hydrolase family protein [Ningiella sp. W23]|uniref:alpha/beta hydrolase family protein n=1 Tax=Ningiella sp. W23 TaxID=3023715 RepID=UPI003756C408